MIYNLRKKLETVPCLGIFRCKNSNMMSNNRNIMWSLSVTKQFHYWKNVILITRLSFSILHWGVNLTIQCYFFFFLMEENSYWLNSWKHKNNMDLSLLTFARICSHINTNSASKFITHKNQFLVLRRWKLKYSWMYLSCKFFRCSGLFACLLPQAVLHSPSVTWEFRWENLTQATIISVEEWWHASVGLLGMVLGS